MSESGRQVYCPECGSIANEGDRFCGVCGARLSADAQDAAPTREIPTIVQSSPRQSRGQNERGLVLGIMGVVAGVLVVAAIVVSGLFSGGNVGKPQAQVNKIPSPNRHVAGPASTNGGSSVSGEHRSLGVGDTATAKGVKATLNGVRRLPKTYMDQPIQNPNDEFLAADMTFENTSDHPVQLSSLLEITLKDEKGYSASRTIHSRQKGFSEGNLAPGDKTSGEIVYEVPQDAQGPSPAILSVRRSANLRLADR